MEIRNLVTFLKVTELNSFSKAAEALDYSQSAVTVQIQQLERELGVRLFDRIGKNVSITQYGKNFISYARDIVSAVARAQVFASEETELTGMVQVGTLNSLMTASFSDIVPAFRQRFGEVGEQYGEPQPQGNLPAEPGVRAGDEAVQEKRGRKHAARGNDEHHGIARQYARIELAERILRGLRIQRRGVFLRMMTHG